MFMASKKRDEKDRISELPRNVMGCIFDLMGIRDAARTSILSRKWRYIWALNPKLVFDENFFNKINTAKHKRLNEIEFTKAISNALLVHGGPILEFVLHIPSIPKDIRPEIDQWMSFLSRNGIKKLEIRNSDYKNYILPSCIFSRSSLIDLKTYNCILRPPYDFEGFRFLVSLMLVKVVTSVGMFAILLRNTPLLENLIINYCSGIDHRSVNAPRLNCFCIVKSGEVDWEWFASNKQLTTVQIELGMEVKNVGRTVNMLKFLKNIDKVRVLWLDGFALKCLAAGNLSRSLATLKLHHAPVPFLTEIRLCNFQVDDVDQLSSSLFLLKRCPNLMILQVDVGALKDNVIEPVTRCLEPNNCIDMNLNKLQTVKITSMKGLKAELLFIKFLLARTTGLHRMIIELGTAISISASNGLKISTELLRFPRASSSAEIIYVVP